MAQIKLPDLFCPFPSALNPQVQAVQQHTAQWVLQHKLVKSGIAYDRFNAAKFGWLAARAYPKAEYDNLAITSDWNTWLFMLDDQCDEAGIGKDPDKLMLNFDRLLLILDNATSPVAGNKLISPMASSLIDIWQRISNKANPEWMARFRISVQDYFEACIWEANNRVHKLIPSVADYIKMRPLSGGLYTDVDLIDITEKINLPTNVRLSQEIQRLTLMANNVVCWSNDLFSLAKEIKNGDVHNLVLALKNEEQLSLEEAVNRAATMHNDEVRAFQKLESELPSYGSSVDVDVKSYIDILRCWMRGNLDWSRDTGRYKGDQTFAEINDKDLIYLEAILTE